MRILKPSKRPGKGRLNSQTDSFERNLDDAGNDVSVPFSEETLLFEESKSTVESSFPFDGSDDSGEGVGREGRHSSSRRRSKGTKSFRRSKKQASSHHQSPVMPDDDSAATGQMGFTLSSEAEAQHQSGAGSALSAALDERKKLYLTIQTSAVRSLAMREHSVQELREKLIRKYESDMDVIEAVLDQLIDDGYVSDERFAEAYVRARRNKGVGPVKIKSELYRKGISDHLIADYLEQSSAVWLEAAEHEYRKKFGGTAVTDYRDWTKRARFLQGRGFTMDHIQVTVPQLDQD